MLQLIIPPVSSEQWDEINEEFIYTEEFKGATLQMEHSLLSISKWESKWCKSFLSRKDKTREELDDYIRCMTVTPNVDPEVYNHLSGDHIKKIQEYIDAPMTATYINENKSGQQSRDVITSELIYYWMIANQIPFSCEKWHLNRLLALIKVCNVKNNPPKKMGGRDLMKHHAAVNASRRKPRAK